MSGLMQLMAQAVQAMGDSKQQPPVAPSATPAPKTAPSPATQAPMAPAEEEAPAKVDAKPAYQDDRALHTFKDLFSEPLLLLIDVQDANAQAIIFGAVTADNPHGWSGCLSQLWLMCAPVMTRDACCEMVAAVADAWVCRRLRAKVLAASFVRVVRAIVRCYLLNENGVGGTPEAVRMKAARIKVLRSTPFESQLQWDKGADGAEQCTSSLPTRLRALFDHLRLLCDEAERFTYKPLVDLQLMHLLGSDALAVLEAQCAKAPGRYWLRFVQPGNMYSLGFKCALSPDRRALLVPKEVTVKCPTAKEPAEGFTWSVAVIAAMTREALKELGVDESWTEIPAIAPATPASSFGDLGTVAEVDDIVRTYVFRTLTVDVKITRPNLRDYQ